jgi:hypothetical protein
MVFIMKGMGIRIPAGGFRISLGDSGLTTSISFDLRIDTWPHWLRIATEHVNQAVAAHTLLMEAHAINDDAAKGQALEAEFSASLVAISAAAFALDAFYGAVKARAPLDAGLEAKWQKNHTSRAKQIVETLRRSFTIKRQAEPHLRTSVINLFHLRDWAVHPPSEFQPPQLHPDLGIGVEWRFAVYRAEICKGATQMVLAVIAQCLRKPKRKFAELEEWCMYGQEKVTPLVETWTDKYGEPFPTG